MRPAIQAVGDQYSEKGWTGGLVVGIPAGLAEFEFEIKPDPRRNYRAPATAVKTRPNSQNCFFVPRHVIVKKLAIIW